MREIILTCHKTQIKKKSDEAEPIEDGVLWSMFRLVPPLVSMTK